MKLSLPPDPCDVRYEDLASEEAAQTGSTFTAYFLTGCIFVFWVPLTAIIGSFTNLQDLKQYSLFAWVDDTSVEFQSFVQSILAQLSLKIVMAILPMMLMMIINFNFLKSGNEAQLRMQDRYFAFLVIFVVLVSALNVTLVHTIQEIALDPWKITSVLAKLPQSSHFYINYLILGWFTLSMALIRISPLAKYLIFSRGSTKTPAEVREMSEPEDQDGDGLGARHAKAGHHMTIAFVFCACTPTISVAAIAWFTFAIYIYRWLILFSETKKADLGGAFWVRTVTQLYFSLGMYVALMLTVLMQNPWGQGIPPLMVALCGAYVLYKYVGFRNIVWKNMPFEAVVDSEEWQTKNSKRDSCRNLDEATMYIQSECEAAEANAMLIQAQAAKQPASTVDGPEANVAAPTIGEGEALVSASSAPAQPVEAPLPFEARAVLEHPVTPPSDALPPDAQTGEMHQTTDVKVPASSGNSAGSSSAPFTPAPKAP